MALFEAEPEGLEGINAHYITHIEPKLAEIEKSRKSGHTIGLVICVLLGIPLVIASFWIAHLFAQDPDADIPSWAAYLIFPPMMIGMGGWGIYKFAFRWRGKAKARYKELLMSEFARFRGFEYAPDGDSGMVHVFSGLNLLPVHNIVTCEDGLSGEIGELNFRYTEALLQVRREYREDNQTKIEYEQVFRGFLVSLDVPKDFDCRVIILREMGVGSFFQKLVTGLERVRLEDPMFERKFEVFSDDQIKSRYLLTPTMMERLSALSDTYKHPTIAFDRGQIHIAVDKQDLFETGSGSESILDTAGAEQILSDMAIFERLINALALDAKTRI